MKNVDNFLKAIFINFGRCKKSHKTKGFGECCRRKTAEKENPHIPTEISVDKYVDIVDKCYFS